MVLQTQALIIVVAYLVGMLLVGFIVGNSRSRTAATICLQAAAWACSW